MPRTKTTKPPNKVQPKAVRKPRTAVRKTPLDSLQEAVVIGADTPAARDMMESLGDALGVKLRRVDRVTKRTQLSTSPDGSEHQQKRRSAGKSVRPETDDPGEMLAGPLVDDDISFDDDDEPGGG